MGYEGMGWDGCGFYGPRPMEVLIARFTSGIRFLQRKPAGAIGAVGRAAAACSRSEGPRSGATARGYRSLPISPVLVRTLPSGSFGTMSMSQMPSRYCAEPENSTPPSPAGL